MKETIGDGEIERLTGEQIGGSGYVGKGRNKGGSGKGNGGRQRQGAMKDNGG